jgi:hypothetical protein
MKAILIALRTLRLPAFGLTLLLAFAFAGRAAAQNPPAPAGSPLPGGTQPATNHATLAPAPALPGADSVRVAAASPVAAPAANGGMRAAPSDSLLTPTLDKSHYNLFNPTPRQAWRPFYTDYGALSPYTIDAGAFSADVNFDYSYSRRTFDEVQRTEESWNVGTTWLKAGLCNNADLEVGIPIWQTRKETDKDYYGQDSETHSGFGDFMTRLKLNVLGNDGGPLAVSVAANMQFPTKSVELGRRDDYEGGLSGQAEYHAPCGFDTRLNTGFTLSDPCCRCSCWQACFDNGISVSHAIVANLSALAAFDAQVSTERHSNWDAQTQVGLILAPTPNFQVFVGSGFGLNGRAEDFDPHVGLSVRF